MTALRTSILGDTGADVTKLGFGAMELRANMGEDAAARLLNAVLDAGITMIDTSPDYGPSEEFIGAGIAHRRDEYFLASKCGCQVEPPPPPDRFPDHTFTRVNFRAGVEQSLRRMRTDHLDLVQVHLSPSPAQLEEDDSIAELIALRDEGKVRFIGMSGTLPHLVEHIEMGVFEVFQIPYSALEREHEQLITDAAKAGAGTIIRGGVAPRFPTRCPRTTPGCPRRCARDSSAHSTNARRGGRRPSATSLTSSTACRAWSSSFASRCRTLTCTPSSSARRTRHISTTTSRPRAKVSSRRLCTRRHSRASTSRAGSTPVLQ